MSHGKSDQEQVRTTHNVARYFTENRHVAWMVLLATVLWGAFSYAMMPKRKDPEIPVRVAAAIAAWPGASAEKIEEQLTRKIEEKLSESSNIESIDSTTRTGVAVIIVTLQENVKDVGKELDDLRMKLDDLADELPQGARPIEFLKEFGDTTALMLTVASPKVGPVEIQLRAKAIEAAIRETRGESAERRVALIYAFPASLEPHELRRAVEGMQSAFERRGEGRDGRVFEGPGFIGLDLATEAGPEEVKASALAILSERLRTS